MKVVIQILIFILPTLAWANPGHGLDNNQFHELGHFLIMTAVFGSFALAFLLLRTYLRKNNR